MEEETKPKEVGAGESVETVGRTIRTFRLTPPLTRALAQHCDDALLGLLLLLAERAREDSPTAWNVDVAIIAPTSEPTRRRSQQFGMTRNNFGQGKQITGEPNQATTGRRSELPLR